MPTTRAPRDPADNPAFRAALCEQIGVPIGSTTAAILNALDARLVAAAYGLTPGTVIIEEDALADLQERAAEGRRVSTEETAQRDVHAVDSAVADGRIAADRRDHWLAFLRSNPHGRAVLDSLARGLLPPGQVRQTESTAKAAGNEIRSSDAYQNWAGKEAPELVRPPATFGDLKP